MSSADNLKRFISDRLAAAAEEIFGVFQKTIVEYEEEIERQRKLVNIVWRPVVKLRRVELPQQGLSKEEEEVLADQQLWNQEMNSTQRQEEPEPPQTKEKPEELCSSQLRLKQEPGDFKLTSPNEENAQSEDQALDWNPEEFSGKSQVKSEVITCVVSQEYRELLPTSNNSHVAVSQDQSEGKHEVSQLMRDARKELKGRQCKSHTNTDIQPTTSDCHSGEEYFTCDKCGKCFTCGSELREHIPTHMNISQHVCQTCGLQFLSKGALSNHRRTHSAKKSHVCQICNKVFLNNSKLMRHAIVHTSERPYRCKICGRAFRNKYSLVPHMRLHTGERPYRCQTCGEAFIKKYSLVNHTASHMDKRSYVCQTCGKAFKDKSTWMVHMKVHTGDRSNLCPTAGKAFPKKSGPVKRVGSRAVENPLFCKRCKKVFVSRSFLLSHMRQFHGDD